ncbi:MAG: hypothetical protein O3A10_02970 [Chloroflexi bacterium]|nr:hypothetical protein [Chloroflexota bacterium]MDA1145132.1 hypothetical protein [Chloroflexota bacterium]
MKPLTLRQTLAWSVILAIAWVVIQILTSDERDPITLASTGGFFFVVAFFSMRLSAQVSAWGQRRFAKPLPPPPEPVAATTDRPDHVQRRRQKRRRRTERRQ